MTFKVFDVVKQVPVANKKSPWTGDGYARVKEGNKLEFTMVRVPHSGNYDVIIRYKPKVRSASYLSFCIPQIFPNLLAEML